MVSVSVMQIPKQKPLYTGSQIVVNEDLQTFYVIVVTIECCLCYWAQRLCPVMLSPGSIEQQPNSLLDSVCFFILSESAKHCLLDSTENVFITCAAAQVTGHHFTDLII